MDDLNIINVDYNNPEHAGWLVYLLDCYARDPVCGSQPLSEFVSANLAAALAGTPGAFSLIAVHENTPVALANCFASLSTFACKPLINIHDLVVVESVRGKGIGLQMLAAVEQRAIETGCCKVTLEVLTGNTRARSVYENFGFQDYSLDASTGHAVLMQKPL